jgi:hypothetical protein
LKTMEDQGFEGRESQAGNRRQGKEWQRQARQGKAKQGQEIQDNGRHGKVREGTAR